MRLCEVAGSGTATSSLGKAWRSHRPGQAVATANPSRRTNIIVSRSPLNHPAHFSDADWAEYQQYQAEHEDLVAQVAEHEAQMAHDLIATDNEHELDSRPVPKPGAAPAPRISPPHRSPATRRRSRGR
ncbi:hypothetical protein [Streptomyces sp. NPDC093109]|uniref:hypothetical protein n=1 Tax=Streptomyces sp. NPDC093109 TaxID=3154977 RepID=UPI00344E2084